jgi:hypothetical protein
MKNDEGRDGVFLHSTFCLLCSSFLFSGLPRLSAREVNRISEAGIRVNETVRGRGGVRDEPIPPCSRGRSWRRWEP